MLWELLETAGHVLDTPGAFARGLLAGKNPLPGVFDPSQRTYGRDVLESWGALGANEEGLDWGDAAGLGMEIATDPLNLFGGALFKRLLGKRSLAKASNKAADVANVAADANNAKRARYLESGGMPEEVHLQTAAKQPVYHGTPHAFDRYDPAKFDPEALYGPGAYHTEALEVAGGGSPYNLGYAEKGGILDGHYGFRKLRPDEEIAAHVRSLPPEELEHLGLFPEDLDFRSLAAPQNPTALADYVGDFLATRATEAYPSLGPSEVSLLKSLEPYLVAEEIPPSPFNVRTHRLDVRNPFDIDATLSAASADTLAGLFSDRAGFGLGNLRAGLEGDRAYGALSNMLGKAQTNQLLADAGYDAITHLGGGRAGGGDLMHQVWIALNPDRQVYAPWIAPLEMAHAAKQPVPRMSPLLAALTSHNALARQPR